jgi:uncharacterized protein YjbJ (UPF0337 family)
MEHKWDELRGAMSKYWSKVSEDDLQTIDGREDKLTDLIQSRYQCSRQRAARDIKRFFESYRKLM